MSQRLEHPSNLLLLTLDLRRKAWRMAIPSPQLPHFLFRSSLQFCAHAFFQDPPRESRRRAMANSPDERKMKRYIHHTLVL
jgi:hypothetical protein